MNKEITKKIIKLAGVAYKMNEIPVGAVVIKNGKIIGEGINNKNKNSSVIGHAEINAIMQASKKNNDWRLDNCEMYVTLKPCMMCTGAIVDSRIKKVYYLCDRTNVCFNANDYIEMVKINDTKLEQKYTKILQLFFENKRKK